MTTRPKNEPLPETCGDKRGTVTGHGRHRKAGEDPCPPCRKAHNKYAATWRQGRPKGQRAAVAQRLRQRALLALKRERPERYREILNQLWAAEAAREAKGA